MFVPQSKRKLQTKLPVVIELGSLNIRAGIPCIFESMF